jgi:predicted SAM-dependent methyltransferase
MVKPEALDSLITSNESARHLAEQGLVTHGVARAIRYLDKELAIMQADAEGRERFAENPPKLQPGLHVGCGSNIIPGFTNFDIFPNPGVDVVSDAREGLPFDDNQFEIVFSEHMLEHVDYPRSAKVILGDMVRVAKPGGRVIVGVPDSSIPVKAFANGDNGYFDELRERWYGNRADLEHYTSPIQFVRLVMADVDDDPVYTPHLSAFDEETLSGLMENAGLVDIRTWDIDPDMSYQKRNWGSVYLQGIKPGES